MPSTVEPQTSRRGWLVILGIFLVLMTSAGLGFYGLSVYLSALNRARGYSVSAMSGATALYFIASGLAGLAVARLLRSHDPRPVAVLGAFVAAAAMVGLGHVHALWHVYAAYALFGVGYAATGLVVSTTLVARWFDRKRAVALSVASTGLSVGGVVMTPIARTLLRNHPLDVAATRIALLYVIGVVPAALLFLRPDPARFGLGPDGAALADDHDPRTTAPARGAAFGDAVGTLVFYGLTATFLLALGAQVGAIAQLDKLAHERISAESAAARIVSVVAACSVIGRLSGSVLLPRVGNRRFTALILSTQAVGLALLSRVSGVAAVTASTVLFGLVIGNVLLLHPLLLATSFGVRDYPRIYGRSQAVTVIGTAVGPFLYGYLRDHAGGYRTSYLVGAAITAASLAVYLLTCGDGNGAVEP